MSWTEAMRLGVLTLNLWNVNEPLSSRMTALAAGLEALRPDIICLQEVAADPRTEERQSTFAAKVCGLSHVIDNAALSILSRFPVASTQSVSLPEAPRDEPRQVLFADVSIGDRLVRIANTHLAWRPESIAERKTQADALLAALNHAEKADATILCGDFNDDSDSPAVRAALAHGFRDAYTECCPGNPGFTWSRLNPYVDRTTPRDQRIDYIFCTDALTPISSAVVFNDRDAAASDHYGVFATFDLP